MYLKEWAEELLEENNFPGKLSEKDFVFWISQGYMFCLFKLDEGDEPPVYYYCEGKRLTNFVKIADSLSSFLYRFYSLDKELFKAMMVKNLFWRLGLDNGNCSLEAFVLYEE